MVTVTPREHALPIIGARTATPKRRRPLRLPTTALSMCPASTGEVVTSTRPRVGERVRVTNRIKATMAWLGIRGFKAGLKNAVQRLSELRTPEGEPLPPNTHAELLRNLQAA